MTELATGRLLLRQWRGVDLEPFAAINRDPEVMRYVPAVLTKAQSDALAQTARGLIARRGWGLWAVQHIESCSFIGFVGLAEPRFDAHFTPAVEVGWRLGREYWGHAYATEAAGVALSFGFGQLGLGEIVSFTAAGNTRSQRVMNRPGMTHDPAEDFDHPAVDGPLRRHVLFRISDEHWQRDSGRTLAGASTEPPASDAAAAPLRPWASRAEADRSWPLRRNIAEASDARNPLHCSASTS